MPKKEFKGGLDDMLSSHTPSEDRSKAAEKPKKLVKATYLYEASLLEDIKALAYYLRKPIGEVINEAINQYATSNAELERARALYKTKT